MSGFLIVLIVIIVAWVWHKVNKGREREAARQRYLGSLEQLKQSPNDPNLRQRTLELGRIYSNLLRDKQGNTVFDEVALMNDLNAACAAASSSTLPSNPQAVAASIEDRLKRLQDLRDKKLIEESEYIDRKREIIGQL